MLQKLTPSELDITNQLAELAFSCLEEPITSDPTKLSPIPFTNLEEALTDLVENYTVIKSYPGLNGNKHLDLKFTLKPEFNRLSYFTPQKQRYAINQTEFQAYNLLTWLSYDGLDYKFSNFLSHPEIKFFYIETYSKLFKPQLKFLQLLQEQLNKYKEYLEAKHYSSSDLEDETIPVVIQVTSDQAESVATDSTATVSANSSSASTNSGANTATDELTVHEQELEEYEQAERDREQVHSGNADNSSATTVDASDTSDTSDTSNSTATHDEIAEHEHELEEYEEKERLQLFYSLAKQQVKNSDTVTKEKDKKSKEKKLKDKSKEHKHKDKLDKYQSKEYKDKYKSSSINSLIEKKLLDLLEVLTDYKVSYDYDQSSSYIESYVSHLVDLKKIAFIQAFTTLTDQYAPYHLESFDCEYESKVVQLCDEIAIDQQAQELVERATIVPVGNFNRANIFGYLKKESSRGQEAPIPGLLHLPSITLALTTEQIEQNPELAIELFDAIKLGSFTLAQAQCYKDAVNSINLEFKTNAKLIILNNSQDVAKLFREFSTPSNTVSSVSGYVTRANFLLEVAKANRHAFLRDYLVNFLEITKEDEKARQFLENSFVQYNVNDFVQGLEELEQEQEYLGTTQIKVADFVTSSGVELSLILDDNYDVASIKNKEIFAKAKMSSLKSLDLVSPEKVYLHSTLITQLLQETLEETADVSDNNGAIPVCICRQQNLDKCCAQESSNFAKAQAEQPDMSQHSSKIYDLGNSASDSANDPASATESTPDSAKASATSVKASSVNATTETNSHDLDELVTSDDVSLDQVVNDSVTAGFNKVNHSRVATRKSAQSSSAMSSTTVNTTTSTDPNSVNSFRTDQTTTMTSSTDLKTPATNATEFKPVDCKYNDQQTCAIASTVANETKDRVKISVDITSEASTTELGKINTETFDSSFGMKSNNQAKTKLLSLLARKSVDVSTIYGRFAEVESGESLDQSEINLLECFDASNFDLKLVPNSQVGLDDIDFSFLANNSLYVNSKPLLEQAKFYYTELVGRLVSLVRLLGYNEQEYVLSYGFVNRLLAILFRNSDTSFEVVWGIQLLDSYLQKAYGRTEIVDRIFNNNHCHNDNFYQDQLNQVLDDYIKITTSDEVVVPGQVNGLACIDSDQIDKEAIGNVFRISCVANNEQGTMLDVDTEIEFSGSTSTRAHIITSSYIKSLFNDSIQFSGTIVTEQLYNEIDGDSASIANFCALSSALSKYPLKQYLAVTGSMDQYGNVLAVGGLNHKIEAFFDICKHRGLTGKQGVIIPATNAKSLQLIDEVVEAVEQGLFHIYTADHASEVFEIMTNIPYMLANDEELSSQATDYISSWGDFLPNMPSLVSAVAHNLNYSQHQHGLFSRIFGKWFKSKSKSAHHQ